MSVLLCRAKNVRYSVVHEMYSEVHCKLNREHVRWVQGSGCVASQTGINGHSCLSVYITVSFPLGMFPY